MDFKCVVTRGCLSELPMLGGALAKSPPPPIQFDLEVIGDQGRISPARR